MEVEKSYRAKITPEDSEKLKSENLQVISTNPSIPSRFIPQTNPFLEKLISLGMEEIESFNPDVIYSWYLVPYGVAGHILSKFSNKPHITQHAGSDLTFLYDHPHFHKLLKAVFKDAKGVITYRRNEDFIQSIGANPLTHRPHFCQEFNPYGSKIDLENMADEDKFESEKTLLFLGKMTKPKGIIYLISSMKHVNPEIKLLIAGGGPLKEEYEKIARKSNLESRIKFIGILPPWSVPPLIRSVKSVVIPEYNFGVPTHQSGIPYEAMLCGIAPLLSEQVSEQYEDPGNIIRSIDPTNERLFARSIELAIYDSEANEKAKNAYDSLRKIVGDHKAYVDRIEEILEML